MKKIEILKCGFKNHPGNLLYAVLYPSFLIAGLQNKDIKSGVIAAVIIDLLLFILHITTAYSVGKANISTNKGGKT